MNQISCRDMDIDNSDSTLGLSRRDFLQSTATALSASTLLSGKNRLMAAQQIRRPKVAAIFTVFRYRSHAHVLLENFLNPYLFNGKETDPRVDVVSFYPDQIPKTDMARKIAKQYKIPMFKTIEKALCLGGKELAVDAVLEIGEHGTYSANKYGQRRYPRKRFFDEIVEVMRRSNRFVPLFNDKHFSYRWDWSKEMYDTTQELGIPFLAGSSVPLAERRPALEIPVGSEIEEAVSIHGGPTESYDFHGLEVLQSMIESRKGGETGISQIEFLRGEALWRAAKNGRWSISLAHEAMAAEFGKKIPSLKTVQGEDEEESHGLLITYKDGFKATVMKVGKSGTRWNFACKIKGDKKPRATTFYTGPWRNRNLFKALAHAIQTHFVSGKPPYPVERTLLTTGALESAMHSRFEGSVVETPHLEFAYKPTNFRAMREMGASWKIINENLPEPKGFDAGPTS